MADGSSGPTKKTVPSGVDPNEVRDWYFTFGFNHDGMDEYVVFNGTWQNARNKMIEQYGLRWGRQWKTAKDAGVEQFNLKRIN